MSRSTKKENEKIQNILIPINNAIAELDPSSVLTSTYGEKAFVDPDLGLVLSEQIRFEGLGVNSNNVSGWLRRYNGMSITNETGMFSNLGMVIVGAEFTCDNDSAGRQIQFLHYNANGGNAVTAGFLNVNQEDNQFGFLTNASLLIPGRRRFAPSLRINSGSGFNRPQLRIDYRKVLGVV